MFTELRIAGHLPGAEGGGCALCKDSEGGEQAIEFGRKELADEAIERLQAVLERPILLIDAHLCPTVEERERLLLVGEHEVVPPDGTDAAEAQGGVVHVADRLAHELLMAHQEAPVLLGGDLGAGSMVQAREGQEGRDKG